MVTTLNGESGHSSELTFGSKLYQKVCRTLLTFTPYYPSMERYNLTISHDKKFVWFRVAKVGTRTIFDICERNDVYLDADHAMFCHYPPKNFEDYYKFSFVRNPWDRLVSCWKNKVVNSNYFSFDEGTLQKMQDFSNFVDFVEGLNIENCDQHLQLQLKLIDMNNIDFIGKFENFEDDLSKVLVEIGINAKEIPKKNASDASESYKQYYDENLRVRVARIYKKDINIFKYEY